jgi:hypothetical protein
MDHGHANRHKTITARAKGSRRKPAANPRPVQMRFMVDEEARWRVSVRVLRFRPLSIIATKLHTHSLTCHRRHTILPTDNVLT